MSGQAKDGSTLFTMTNEVVDTVEDVAPAGPARATAGPSNRYYDQPPETERPLNQFPSQSPAEPPQGLSTRRLDIYGNTIFVGEGLKDIYGNALVRGVKNPNAPIEN